MSVSEDRTVQPAVQPATPGSGIADPAPLGLTEIFGFIGGFANSAGVSQLSGYVGILTALVAWYASFAGVANGLGGRIRVPVGKPLLSAP